VRPVSAIVSANFGPEDMPTPEIGIRLALGGQPREAVGAVIAEGLALTGGGLVLGLVAGALLAHSMKELLFQVEPTDSMTYASIVVSMTAVALLASCGPALHAARIAPMEVLRS
jgi:putative ABC transport system permease protein